MKLSICQPSLYRLILKAETGPDTIRQEQEVFEKTASQDRRRAVRERVQGKTPVWQSQVSLDHLTVGAVAVRQQGSKSSNAAVVRLRSCDVGLTTEKKTYLLRRRSSVSLVPVISEPYVAPARGAAEKTRRTWARGGVLS